MMKKKKIKIKRCFVLCRGKKNRGTFKVEAERRTGVGKSGGVLLREFAPSF
jgi:hypothetical protein